MLDTVLGTYHHLDKLFFKGALLICISSSMHKVSVSVVDTVIFTSHTRISNLVHGATSLKFFHILLSTYSPIHPSITSERSGALPVLTSSMEAAPVH